MNKAEFLGLLRARLVDLPQSDIEKAAAYYAENIDDRIENGESEEQAVSNLGNMDDIVNAILMDTPLPRLIRSKIKEGSKKIKGNTLWIVLAICGLPFWLPIVFSIFMAFFAVYISIWAVIVSIYAALFSLAVASVTGLIAGVIQCITQNYITGLAVIGLSGAAGGLFFIVLLPSVWLSKMIIVLTVKLVICVKRFFVPKKEVSA